MGALVYGQGCIQSGIDLLAYLVAQPSRLGMVETHGHLKAYAAATTFMCGCLCDGLSGGQTMGAFWVWARLYAEWYRPIGLSGGPNHFGWGCWQRMVM